LQNPIVGQRQKANNSQESSSLRESGGDVLWNAASVTAMKNPMMANPTPDFIGVESFIKAFMPRPR
jgi:hypothetical protein